MPVEELISHKEPMAVMEPPAVARVDVAFPKSTHALVPKEIWMLIDCLMKYHSKTLNLFSWCSEEFQVSSLLNPGASGPSRKVHAQVLYNNREGLATAQTQVRRIVDTYSPLVPPLTNNHAAVTRTLLCLLASTWQHSPIDKEIWQKVEATQTFVFFVFFFFLVFLHNRLYHDQKKMCCVLNVVTFSNEKIFVIYANHIGPIYKTLFQYLVSFVSYLVNAGHNKTEVIQSVNSGKKCQC